MLHNPKVKIVTDDGRRWLRANPGQTFDAIVSNTTWHFRANVTNLVSREFLELIKPHLTRGGIFFYNTTDSDRVQRTGCLAFPYGARFTNHMVVSQTPIAWDFARWRRVLEAYKIDGRAVFDPARNADRAELDLLMTWQEGLAPTSQARPGPADRALPCPPRPHRRQEGRDRRQHGQRVAVFPRPGLAAGPSAYSVTAACLEGMR